MAERSKAYLKQEFRDGERPSGADFGDLIESFVNKTDDFDTSKNLNLPAGVNLGDVTTGKAGTLRFNSGTVQFHNGSTWNNIASGGFGPAGSGNSLGYDPGTGAGVAIGPNAPTTKLDVQLGNNLGPFDRARFGNVIISNGTGTAAADAQVSHNNHSSNTGFALRQTSGGDVYVNAPAGSGVFLTQGGTSTTPRLSVISSGQVVIGNNALLSANGALQVNGDAFKNAGTSAWLIASDVRLKKDIQPFEDGLEKLMQVRPIRFRYNGLLNQDTDKEYVGIIGQDLQPLFPYMIMADPTMRIPGTVATGEGTSSKEDGMLTYDSSAFTYVLINAVQELTRRVQALEKQLEKQAEKQPERSAKARKA
ncbi:tail fiber domain-containing protein [Chitinophaga japonensis]|uniref:Endosialidase-like protein n=1 Tax=Chitinophaga japonensis TaxID=104662 RepID=A0A562T1R7_CHIJA|nr:tail fiber domain-containing protein [Chitinophaga japonensis]TWI87024.1 endosialidase-like protein [Chitinophaga japonensis]